MSNNRIAGEFKSEKQCIGELFEPMDVDDLIFTLAFRSSRTRLDHRGSSHLGTSFYQVQSPGVEISFAWHCRSIKGTRRGAPHPVVGHPWLTRTLKKTEENVAATKYMAKRSA